MIGFIQSRVVQMIVYLTSAYEPSSDHPYDQNELKRLQHSAEHDVYQKHTLTNDPKLADLIIFAEGGGGLRFYDAVRKHPLVKLYRDKCFLLSATDHPFFVLPGVYTSAPSSGPHRQRTRGSHYLRGFTKDFVVYDASDCDRAFLFSFLGNVTNHPVRRAIGALDYDRAYFLDTSGEWPYGQLQGEAKQDFEQQYVEVSRRSSFILAPRGKGPSSHRLFEAMQMGRAPVIISDAWREPMGPDWNLFSVRVRERDVHQLSNILEEREHEAIEMGKRARLAWEEWFSLESSFNSVVEWCLDIQKSRQWPESVQRFLVYTQLLNPLYFRQFVRRIHTTKR